MSEDTSEYYVNPKCPHCGEHADTWFDRSIWHTPSGEEIEYETFATRCVKCGKNVDAPPSYYKQYFNE